MKQKLAMLLAVGAILTAFSMPAHAMEYSFEAPDAGLFGRPTSDETIYVGVNENINIDRSKNAAYIPPSFGSPTSYTVGNWELLTPNLVNQNNAGGMVAGSGVTIVPPSTVPILPGNGYEYEDTYKSTAYTSVTSDLYYSAGYLGTLKISTIDLSVKVYQGTDSATLVKGAGHYTETSIWDGNVAIAAHNRGVTNHFGKIHTLEKGDKITLTTKLGTRTYKVQSVTKILATDLTVLNSSSDNLITLTTCVMNQPDYRWCVVGKMI